MEQCVRQYRLLLVAQDELPYNPLPLMDSPDAAAQAVRPLLEDLAREEVYAVAVDGQKRMIGIYLVGAGTLNQSLVCPREVFGFALTCGAASVFLAHNHPSGNLDPSVSDINTTKALKAAGELLQIHLLDHIIIGRHGSYTSLRELGHLL